ncbi:MAG: NAD(P)-binding protein [Dehalococcoidia bacterium]|nr:NAD(P)-binding protein [Dehalococcoidia bacterium]
MFDAVVIGAGPAGSHTAKRLDALGYRVVVVEEHNQIGKPAYCTDPSLNILILSYWKVPI